MSDLDLLRSLYDKRGIKYEIQSPFYSFGAEHHQAIVVTVDYECDRVIGYRDFFFAHAFDESGKLTGVFSGE